MATPEGKTVLLFKDSLLLLLGSPAVRQPNLGGTGQGLSDVTP